MADRRVLYFTPIYQGGLLGVGGALSWALWPVGLSSLLIGGLLMGANFVLLVFLGDRVVRGGQGKVTYALLLAMKLVLMMAAIAIVVTWFAASALGFVAGMASLFGGLAMAMVHVALAGGGRSRRAA